LIIPYDCIIERKISNIKFYELKYLITKNVYGSGFIESKTIANEKTISLVKKIKEIIPHDNKYLGYNITQLQLRKTLSKIVEENYDILGVLSDSIDNRFVGTPKEVSINNKTLFINKPLLKQFRVYFDSELKARGYNEYARAKLLGHTDEKMLDYYGREAGPAEEDINYAKFLVKGIINDENLRILGPKGDKYTKRINNFIDRKTIHVESDIDKIINEVLENVPIRMKLGGCCIKPYNTAVCNIDENTDELLCSYGICSNQCHCFFDCIYHYKRFQEAIKIINHNKTLRLEKMAQKELYKLQANINDKLLPEFIELQRMINIEGKSVIKEKYPDLVYIINNEKIIMEDIEKWKNKRKI
jgi:hypothetical protein